VPESSLFIRRKFHRILYWAWSSRKKGVRRRLLFEYFGVNIYSADIYWWRSRLEGKHVIGDCS
jgi:hypothetical protein